ncbi:hypothetical protein [Chromohalobacter israelensis]|uniref:hypothetical protein n=1 Tax=Chromohalobacter israelensis TaxID=141390 RepID=UPI0011B23938|nr:hypothetical protein [Chromohalobacter salexigens]
MTEKRGRPPNKPYSKLSEIPPHVFKNRVLTDPVGKDLRDYLRYMLANHPDDLNYLYRHAMKYNDHGGGFYIAEDKWRKRLANKLKNYEKEDGK